MFLQAEVLYLHYLWTELLNDEKQRPHTWTLRLILVNLFQLYSGIRDVPTVYCSFSLLISERLKCQKHL